MQFGDKRVTIWLQQGTNPATVKSFSSCFWDIGRRLPLLRLFSFSAVRPAPHRRYPASCAKKSVFQGGLFCLSARAWGRRVWHGSAHGAVLRSFQIHPMQSDCFLRAEFGKVCRRKVLYSGLKCGIIIAKYLSPAPRGAQASEVSHRLA